MLSAQANLTNAKYNSSVQDAQRELTATKYSNAPQAAQRLLTDMKYGSVAQGNQQELTSAKYNASAQEAQANLTATKYNSSAQDAERQLTEMKYHGAEGAAKTAALQNSEKTQRQLSALYDASRPKDGVAGKDGVNGKDGKDGLAGKDGVAGITTTVIQHAELNNRATAANTQRLDSVESHQKAQDKRISDNDKKASAGISSAFAMSNIPQVTDSQQFAVGAGVGGYDSEAALAVGASFHAGERTIVKMTVSDDTDNNFGYGAGVSVGW